MQQKKNCSSWSDEHISLSIVIHLSSFLGGVSVYIYIHTIIDIAIHLFVFVGVYICNYIIYILLLLLFTAIVTHIRIMVILRSIYTCAC